jgi:hypothetical protein
MGKNVHHYIETVNFEHKYIEYFNNISGISYCRKYTFEKTKRQMKNGQFRDTGNNIGYTRHIINYDRHR